MIYLFLFFHEVLNEAFYLHLFFLHISISWTGLTQDPIDLGSCVLGKSPPPPPLPHVSTLIYIYPKKEVPVSILKLYCFLGFSGSLNGGTRVIKHTISLQIILMPRNNALLHNTQCNFLSSPLPLWMTLKDI